MYLNFLFQNRRHLILLPLLFQKLNPHVRVKKIENYHSPSGSTSRYTLSYFYRPLWGLSMLFECFVEVVYPAMLGENFQIYSAEITENAFVS